MKRIVIWALLLLLATFPMWAVLPATLRAQVTRESLVAGPVTTASSGDVTAAVSTATLAAPTGSGISPAGTWYVTMLEVTGNQATSAASVVCTITGLLGGTMTLDIPVTVIATPNPVTMLNFPGGLAGNPGTAIVFSCPSMGSGNLHAAINIHGVLIR
jgi:hypothetical protein